LLLIDLALEKSSDEYLFQSYPLRYRVAVGVACSVGVILFGANQANAFIYFQF
jgi:hypothetical protein